LSYAVGHRRGRGAWGNLAKISLSPLSHPSHLQPPTSIEPPPGRARWRPGLWPNGSVRSHASGRPDTPPPSPNPQQPTTPPVGHPLARALTAPHTRHGRRERALHSRLCTHAFLPSRTRACKASKPRHHATLAVSRIRSTLTEPDQFTTGRGSNPRSPLHHWTESTTPSPAHRPNHPIASDECTLNRDHPEALKTTSPSHTALSARHLPPLHIPSPLWALPAVAHALAHLAKP
jgi:hypothetical protein